MAQDHYEVARRVEEISVTFLPQSRGAEHGARSPRLDQA